MAERPPRYIDGIRRALAGAMEADDGVTVMGVDVGAGGGVYGATRGLQERFGAERVIDAPIAEAGLLGAAVGAAMSGLRPVAEIMYMDFITVCLDPIVNQAAKLRYMTGGGLEIPIVFRTQTGGGRSSGAQHSQSLEGMLAHVPGLKVFLPGDARDAEDLLGAAIEDDGPVVFVENRRLYSRPDDEYGRDPLPPGRARIVREGSDLTLITWGRMVAEAVRACDERLDGVAAEVIDVRTLSPLDMETLIASVSRTGRAIVLHEAVEAFGPAAEIAMRLTESLLYEIEGPIRRLGAVSAPTPYSPSLEERALPASDSIAAAVNELLAL